MPLSLQLEGQTKAQLAVSLAALLLSDSKVEITADNLNAVLAAATIEVPSYLPVLYAAYLEKSGGVSKFLSGPSASSGGGGK